MAFSSKKMMGQLTSWSMDNVGSGALAMESEEQNSNRSVIMGRTLYTQKGGLSPGVSDINPPALSNHKWSHKMLKYRGNRLTDEGLHESDSMMGRSEERRVRERVYPLV